MDKAFAYVNKTQQSAEVIGWNSAATAHRPRILPQHKWPIVVILPWT